MEKVFASVLCVIVLLMLAGPAEAAEQAKKNAEAQQLEEIVVSPKDNETISDYPAATETETAEDIERINTVDTADVLKYMPDAYVRKLYPGSTNRPLAIRGNPSSLTGRTLVLADGIQISNFLGSGSSYGPRWQTVSPDEIESVDLLYGPYSAAFSGNSFGGAAIITTRMPEKKEVRVDTGYIYQNYREYRTDEDLHGYTVDASFGNKTGRFSYMLLYNRLDTQVQPITFQNVQASAGKTASGTPVARWVPDQDPKGEGRYILGSVGAQDITNNIVKLKLAFDLTPRSRIGLQWVFWDMEQDYESPETYLRDADGNPVYSGDVIIDGKGYTVAPGTFYYQKTMKQDFLYGLTYSLDSPDGLKVSAAVSYYDIFKDLTRKSTTPPPLSRNGGDGSVVDNDGGWYTADLKVSQDIEGAGKHTVAAGYHFDRYKLDAATWNASDWKADVRTGMKQRDEGKTITHAVFLEDTWKIGAHWSLYLGGRYEWWKGFDGVKTTESSGNTTMRLPDRRDSGFSPKFSATFNPSDGWSLRFAVGLADRYPTVGELYYGSFTSTGVINDANPDLKPESIFAKEFTITRTLGRYGDARLSFFQNDISDAIYSQTNSYTNVKNYQNVDEVRTRGVEFSANARGILIDGLGLSGNVAWIDSEILKNDNVPTSVGKTFPGVPKWRAKGVVDYTPSERWSVMFAANYSSRPYYQLDNSDVRGGYGGYDKYLVFDAKLSFQLSRSVTASLGVDNITDVLYHEYHPYSRRTVYANLKFAL